MIRIRRSSIAGRGSRRRRIFLGSTMAGRTPSAATSAASATLTFTGVAVYYVVPRWPYAVSTQLSLDGGPGVVV
ncbi:hypothetical protein B0H14DRAFT_2738722, partial [Mycena olivaceomarginata]